VEVYVPESSPEKITFKTRTGRFKFASQETMEVTFHHLLDVLCIVAIFDKKPFPWDAMHLDQRDHPGVCQFGHLAEPARWHTYLMTSSLPVE
jgi:hypothetical protein